MKRIFLPIIVLMCFVGTSFDLLAQQAKKAQSSMEKAEAHTNKLTKILDLDRDQQDEIYVIVLAAEEEIGDLKGLKKKNPEKFREKRKSIRKACKQEVRDVLTGDQLSLYKEHLKNNRGNKGGGKNYGKGKGKGKGHGHHKGKGHGHHKGDKGHGHHKDGKGHGHHKGGKGKGKGHHEEECDDEERGGKGKGKGKNKGRDYDDYEEDDRDDEYEKESRDDD